MEVRCSISERIVLCLAVLTVQSADRALMPASVEVKADTWLKTALKKEVRLEVMLSHRTNPQDATTAKPPKRNNFYALKGREE